MSRFNNPDSIEKPAPSKWQALRPRAGPSKQTPDGDQIKVGTKLSILDESKRIIRGSDATVIEIGTYDNGHEYQINIRYDGALRLNDRWPASEWVYRDWDQILFSPDASESSEPSEPPLSEAVKPDAPGDLQPPAGWKVSWAGGQQHYYLTACQQKYNTQKLETCIEDGIAKMEISGTYDCYNCKDWDCHWSVRRTPGYGGECPVCKSNDRQRKKAREMRGSRRLIEAEAAGHASGWKAVGHAGGSRQLLSVNLHSTQTCGFSFMETGVALTGLVLGVLCLRRFRSTRKDAND